MKIKIDFVAFQSSIIAPGTIGSEITLCKSTKYKDVEMEFHTEGYLVIQVDSKTKPVIVPGTNIKSMVAAEMPQSAPIAPKK